MFGLKKFLTKNFDFLSQNTLLVTFREVKFVKKISSRENSEYLEGVNFAYIFKCVQPFDLKTLLSMFFREANFGHF